MFVTIVSVVVAVTMGVIMMRMVRDERRRSDARVAALAADIEGADIVPRAATFDRFRETSAPVTSSADLFTAAPTMPARSGLAMVLMLGALIVGTAISLAVVFAGTGTKSTHANDTPRIDRAGSVSSPVGGPLELVALGHERDGNGLVVRGVLRNPASGAEVRQLSAVVMMFNHDGGFVATGRAPVQATVLEPGRETTFIVSIPSAAGVERYRVSFRTDDRVVPHVDVRS